MNKILSPQEAAKLSEELQRQGEEIVLAGGCFDILHKGHLIFLKNAKEHGTKLIILLEDDENVRKLKGEGRPVHKQLERAKILASVSSVDYVVLLSKMKNDQDYAKLLNQIKPNVIAITSDDPYLKNKTGQAKNIGAKVVSVTRRVIGESTTKLVSELRNNL